jgi:hypothetical protein
MSTLYPDDHSRTPPRQVAQSNAQRNPDASPQRPPSLDPDHFAATARRFGVEPPPSLAAFLRLCRLLGIHPLLALALFGGDWMLGGLEAISLGLFAFLSALIALLLLAPCAVVQHHSYGEPWSVAWSKATICSILLAIPSPLPSFLTASLGVAGAIAMKHDNGTH